MIVLIVLFALAIVAMSGLFGYRGGAYWGPGIVAGLVFLVTALALSVSGVIR